MPVSIGFQKRDFVNGGGPVVGGGWLPVPGVALAVERLEWRAVGGPWSGRIRALGSLPRLWALVDLLRCPVTISEQAAGWWGYVSGLEMILPGGGSVLVDLEEMGNSVAVSYAQYRPVGATRITTDFVTDADSVRMYGIKQRVFSLKEGSMWDAQAYAATMLKQVCSPVISARAAASAGTASRDRQASLTGAERVEPRVAYALLHLRGWWSTLDWCFYADERGLEGDVSDGAQQRLGDSSAESKLAQPFAVGPEDWQLMDVWVRGCKELAGDSLMLDICPDSAGAPGDSLASANLAAAEIPNEADWMCFVLDPPLMLEANAGYHLVLSRSGAINAAQFYSVSVDQDLRYPGGSLRLWNGAGWAARPVDANLTFALRGGEETTSQLTRLCLSREAGQFISDAQVEQDSGVCALIYKSGTERGGKVAADLLNMGTSMGARLLATVEQGRAVRVYQQPGAPGAPNAPGAGNAGAGLLIGAGGQVTRGDGRPLKLDEWPAGRWARLGEYNNPGTQPWFSGAVFIEACAWDPIGGIKVIDL